MERGSYEFQSLYGMADPIKDVLVNMGHRVRIYTPYGQLLPGMAYLVRRLLENTSNESFLRASFKDQRPEDELLKNPSNQGPDVRQSLTYKALPDVRTADRNHAMAHEQSVPRFQNEP